MIYIFLAITIVWAFVLLTLCTVNMIGKMYYMRNERKRYYTHLDEFMDYKLDKP